MYHTPNPNDIKPLKIEQHGRLATVSIYDYDDNLITERTVTSTSLNWGVKDMGKTAIDIAKQRDVGFHQLNIFYARGLWKRVL